MCIRDSLHRRALPSVALVATPDPHGRTAAVPHTQVTHLRAVHVVPPAELSWAILWACEAEIKEVAIHAWAAGLNVHVEAAVVCRAWASTAGGCAARSASPAIAGAASGPPCGQLAILKGERLQRQ
eukprot:2537876-Prymnesium_polylepis.1